MNILPARILGGAFLCRDAADARSTAKFLPFHRLPDGGTIAAEGTIVLHPKAIAVRLLATGLIAMVLAEAAAAKSVNIIGVIFTLDANRVQTVWPNAQKCT